MTEKLISIAHISKDLVGGIGTVIINLNSHFKSYVNIYYDDTDNNNQIKKYRLFVKKYKGSLRNINIIHFHGAWTFHILPLLRKQQKPTVISPHGAFHKISLEKSKIKKFIAKYLYIKRCYQNVSCVHALSLQEARDIRDYGIQNIPIAVIPNGINIREELNINYLLKDELLKKANGRRIILSLSRLHVSKGIDILIEAIDKLRAFDKEFVLFIAGSGDPKYEQHLIEKTNRKGLNENIFFLGEMIGDSKTTVYSIADIFILPSFNEGFGLTVLEAYRQKLPVITTTSTPFNEINKVGCGWFVNPTSEDLFESLRDFMKLDKKQLSSMGSQGYNWISTNYSIDNTNKKMEDLYEWLLGKNKKPDFLIEPDA